MKIGTKLHRFQKRHDGTWQYDVATVIPKPRCAKRDEGDVWIKVPYSCESIKTWIGEPIEGTGWCKTPVAALYEAQKSLLVEYTTKCQKLGQCFFHAFNEGTTDV